MHSVIKVGLSPSDCACRGDHDMPYISGFANVCILLEETVMDADMYYVLA